MINSTELKNFTFLNTKIPYNGLHICAIDYGEVLHKKFKINYKDYSKPFLKNRKEYFFYEIFNDVIYVILNFDKYVYNCKKNKKKCPSKGRSSSSFLIPKELENRRVPWERSNIGSHNCLKMMIEKHNDFYITVKNKYTKLFPNSLELINYVEENLDNFEKKIKNEVKISLIYQILRRIVYEFQINYPKLYKKYNYWCSYHHPNLPKEDILDILSITNVDDLFSYFCSKI
jgi:hypothetical protein